MPSIPYLTAISTLVQGYLDTAAAHAAGVPEWTIRRQDDGQEIEHPSICVRADERTGARLRSIVVTVDVVTAQEVAEAATEATGALAAVQALLRDESSLWAYIAAQDISLRSGWSIHHITQVSPADVTRDPELVTMHRAAIELLIQVA
jgi:hypothetical protein